MDKVKIFSTATPESLENEINDFLQDRKAGRKFIAVSFSTIKSPSATTKSQYETPDFHALLVYSEPTQGKPTVVVGNPSYDEDTFEQ